MKPFVILEGAAAVKIRNNRKPYRRNRQALGFQPHKHEFFHRRRVFFQQHRCTIGMACAQAVALRVARITARRHVAAPRDLPPLNMAYDEYQARGVAASAGEYMEV
jgi:hypothetical protein